MLAERVPMVMVRPVNPELIFLQELKVALEALVIII